MIKLELMFLEYGEANIRRWCTTLKVFRLCKSYPYPNDINPNRFIASIKFTSEEELLKILQKLNLAEDKSKPEQSRFKEYNEHHSAGWQLLNGISCLISINKLLQEINIQVSGNKEDLFTLEEITYERTKQIEEFLLPLDLVFVAPPQDDDYCISPKYYPELWEK